MQQLVGSSDRERDRERIHQHDLTTYPCNPKVHNVLIVGFGDFEGRHYWIVQNLWREG
ncbi:unnamed protein product [Brassica rapa subsp. trilocularis]